MRAALLLALATVLLAAPPARAEPEKIVIGAYVNDVQSIDLKQHTYAVDVYIWLRWKNPDLDPSVSLEFINPSELWGHVRENNFEKPIEQDGELYQLIRVQGRFSRKLPLNSYPFDRNMLAVTVEDSVHEAAALQYVSEGVTLNPDLELPGFLFDTPRLVVQDFHYPTDFGDPRQRKKNVFSRARIEIPIHRPALPYSIKLLLPVLGVVICAGFMFLIKPIWVDSTIAIGITCLLTLVALQITLNEDLPEVAYLTLMDEIYVGAYLYVVAGLAVVVKTTTIVDTPDGHEHARVLHRRALYILTTFYAVAMTILIGLAVHRG